MSKNIIVNSKSYTLKPIDFNAFCELSKLGCNILKKEDINDIFNAFRANFAFHSDLPLELAGKEIENHLSNGGKFDDFSILIEHITKSDFFTKMSKNENK